MRKTLILLACMATTALFAQDKANSTDTDEVVMVEEVRPIDHLSQSQVDTLWVAGTAALDSAGVKEMYRGGIYITLTVPVEDQKKYNSLCAIVNWHTGEITRYQLLSDDKVVHTLARKDGKFFSSDPTGYAPVPLQGVSKTELLSICRVSLISTLNDLASINLSK